MFRQACQGCKTRQQEGQLADLLTRYEAVFSKNDQDVGRTKLVHYSIPTTEGTRSIRQPPYRFGPHKVQELLVRGMIELANGAWNSPVVLAPLPHIDESLDALAGSKYFNTLDLTSGYCHAKYF